MNNTFVNNEVMITPSDVIEWAYCPRFIYFMYTQQIPQHEELRYKVMLGRDIHKQREKTNKSYLRKKIDCVKKEINVYLASPQLHIRGVVDEVLHFADGSAGPLDYKLSEYRDYTFNTHLFQLTLYAMLIEYIYLKPVYRGYIIYTEGQAVLKEIQFTEADYSRQKDIIAEIVEVIQRGHFPEKTKVKSRCIDCCYRNICIQ